MFAGKQGGPLDVGVVIQEPDPSVLRDQQTCQLQRDPDQQFAELEVDPRHLVATDRWVTPKKSLSI